jgi:GTP-binding protein Era
MEEGKSIFRAGYVAIVGEPNVGKSTLLNAFLGQKVSIVARKPQTTRQRVTGILSRADAQIIFLDTPGFLKPKYLLHKEMVKHAELALKDADVVLAMVAPRRHGAFDEDIQERILPLHNNKPVFLALNKIDRVEPSRVSQAIDALGKKGIFDEVIPISALKGDNVPRLLQSLIEHLPAHEQYYPPDIVSRHPERFFVAEFIREQVFEQFREEIPYAAAVEIGEFKERDGGKFFIAADILVERESQKGIVIGRGGGALKKIGVAARKVIEDFLQHEVFLELRVKVKEKWRESESMMRRFGYHSEKE